MKFNPQIQEYGTFDPVMTLAQASKEPRLVGVSMALAYEKGGQLTRRIMKALGDATQGYGPKVPKGLHAIVDTRCQRLMPGMYPAIPGWHCDDIPRPTYEGQPDFSLVNPEARHFTAYCETVPNVSNTEYVLSPFEFTPTQGPVWRELHRTLENSRGLLRGHQRAGVIMAMSHDTPHRATACQNRGWRFWLRLSFMHRKPEAPLIASQEHVYVVSEANGW